MSREQREHHPPTGHPARDKAARLAGRGRVDEALAALAGLLAERPDDHAARLDLFGLLAGRVRGGWAPPPPPPPPRSGPDPMVSVVLCSIDPGKRKAVASMYSRLLAGRPHELIVLDDARSLCEAYNRGIRKAAGEILVFSHDDVEFLAADFFDRLAGHLDAFHLVGFAGATRVAGPSWIQPGWLAMRGQVTTPDPSGRLRTDVYGVDGPVTDGIQATDGLCIACRREVAETLGFDEATFDGFHLYDIDFSYRAFRHGFRLGVVNDIPVIHRSRGRLGPDWMAQAKRFAAKYPDQGFGLHFGENPLRAVLLDTPDQVARFCHAILDLARRAPAGVLAPPRQPAAPPPGAPPLLGLLPPGLGTVIHAGCRDGLAGLLYKRTHPDSVWWGLEDDPAFAALAAERLDRVAAEQLPDGPVCALILDGPRRLHLDRPARLRALAERLRPGGWLLASLPNPQHWREIQTLLTGGADPLSGTRRVRDSFVPTLEEALSALSRTGLTRFEIAPLASPDQNAPPLVEALTGVPGLDPQALRTRTGINGFIIRAQRQDVS
ncbi:MAG: glycosyltransferase family protein [Caulobacter sp.]|nr:glycosyltransferase family protein [Caulobacter sp.]